MTRQALPAPISAVAALITTAAPTNASTSRTRVKRIWSPHNRVISQADAAVSQTFASMNPTVAKLGRGVVRLAAIPAANRPPSKTGQCRRGLSSSVASATPAAGQIAASSPNESGNLKASTWVLKYTSALQPSMVSRENDAGKTAEGGGFISQWQWAQAW